MQTVLQWLEEDAANELASGDVPVGAKEIWTAAQSIPRISGLLQLEATEENLDEYARCITDDCFAHLVEAIRLINPDLEEVRKNAEFVERVLPLLERLVRYEQDNPGVCELLSDNEHASSAGVIRQLYVAYNELT